MAAAAEFTYDYYLQSLNQMFQEAWNINLPRIKGEGIGIDKKAPQPMQAC